MLSFTLTLAPQAWQRVRRTRTGHCYVPIETRGFKANLESLVRSQYRAPPLEGPLRLELRFYLPMPRKPKWVYPAVRPDLDNYIKSVLDGANGVLWLDDAQIVSLMAKKLYGEPHIELEVDPL